MKLKENLKRFWTLSGSRKGFTLVELIVVIAILAILAGVAIPVYNGYIKKAQTAADQQLLDTINTAFAAACITNDVNVSELTETTAKMPLVNGKVNISGILARDAATSAKVQADFALFYGENEESAFDNITSLIFVQQVDGKDKYCFVDGGEGATINLPGGGTLTLTAEQYELLKNSTYSKDIAGLLYKVDEMGGLVNGLMGMGADATAALNEFKSSEEYLTNIIKALGGTVDPNASISDLNAQYNTLLGDYKNQQVINAIAEATGKDPADVDIYGDDFDMYNSLNASVRDEIDKNVLILGVAQSAANASKDGALAIINSEDPKQLLKDAMTGSDTSASGMANAALVYGMYTAYANSDAATETAKNAVASGAGATAVFNALNGDELTAFQKYLTTTQGQADMNACVAAMQAVNSTASDADAVNGILVNGFADSDLIAEMEKLFK